jgi:hypothetical protein
MSSNQTKNADVAALYARVSSDLQSAASIDDQLRMCREHAAKEGWLVAGSYTDQGVSGASLIDPASRSSCRMAPTASSTSFSPSPSTASPGTRRTSPTSTSGCSSRT